MGMAVWKSAFLGLVSVLAVIGWTETSFAASERRPEVTGASLEFGYVEFPPFFFTAENGQADGLLIRLAGEVFRKLDQPWHAAAYPATRLMENVNKGITQTTMLIRHPTLDDTAIYGQTPVATIRLRAYWRGDKAPIKSKQDIAGKSVIILRGYGYSGWIKFIKNPKNNIRYNIADSHRSAFEMLQKGRADYVLDYHSPATQALSQMDIPSPNNSLVQEFDVFFIVSGEVPGAKALSSQVDELLRELPQ